MNAQSFQSGSEPPTDSTRSRHTLGIIGAGKLGRAIGHSAADAGWRVLFHDEAVAGAPGAGPAANLPDARFVELDELVEQAEVIMLAIPFGSAAGLDYTGLGDRIVLDAMNHWEPVDGGMPELADWPQGTSALIASHNPAMRMVKSLNHLSYHDYTSDARSPEVADRRAVAVATDDARAAESVSVLVNDLGFDPVPVPWNRGRLLEPGGPVFGRWLTARQLRELLA